MHDADPLTYLTIRMALVVGLMAVIAAIARPQSPDRIGIAHSVVAGILVDGFYQGGHRDRDRSFDSRRALGADSGLQPILTSTSAIRWLGERVTPLRWTGCCSGSAAWC